jgi:DNA-directed RNA polymerase specialized sigma24 family protein
MVYQILGDERAAEAASVDTFARVWHNAHRFDEREPVRLFLYRHAVAAALKSSDYTGRSGLKAPASRSGFALALQVLDIGDRIPLVLYYSEGLSAAEIGRVLGRPRFWISLRLLEARHRLREVCGVFAGTGAGTV